MSFSTGAIQEANKHILALSKRNFELEERVKELSEVIRKQNEAHAENLAVLPLRMKQTMKQKDEQIQELREKVRKLKHEASEREMLMEHFRNKCKILDEVARHKEAFESVLACLDIVQEPDYDADEENNGFYTKATRETDLLNDYEAEDNGSVIVKEKMRPCRIDSGIGEESGSSN